MFKIVSDIEESENKTKILFWLCLPLEAVVIILFSTLCSVFLFIVALIDLPSEIMSDLYHDVFKEQKKGVKVQEEEVL